MAALLKDEKGAWILSKNWRRKNQREDS